MNPSDLADNTLREFRKLREEARRHGIEISDLSVRLNAGSGDARAKNAGPGSCTIRTVKGTSELPVGPGSDETCKRLLARWESIMVKSLTST